MARGGEPTSFGTDDAAGTEYGAGPVGDPAAPVDGPVLLEHPAAAGHGAADVLGDTPAAGHGAAILLGDTPAARHRAADVLGDTAAA